MRDGLYAAALTGLATGLGALPFFFIRQLPRRAYDGILGLGAGLMLAAATLGLLAHALEGVRVEGGGIAGARLAVVVAGFVVGVGLAAFMDRFIPHRHARGHRQHLGQGHGVVHAHDHPHDADDHTDLASGRGAQSDRRRVYMIVGALSIHRLPEGLAIGTGFAASDTHRLGWLLAAAVALQNICEGVVMGAPLRQAGVSSLRALLIVLLTGAAIPLGALFGLGTSAASSHALPFVLALAGGTLIYVTSNEIIPESHSHGHEGTASAGVVAGFLLTMVLAAALH